ncbi:MAG: hypothetical protein JW955_18495, partial [Sedimentisphaerales bacterium]|nr:hypothetical protein [Sedimentisphaerales bacterium]
PTEITAVGPFSMPILLPDVGPFYMPISMRARYNALLRERSGRKESVFDLAFWESLGPDGFQYYHIVDGQKFPVLVRSYTDDGGHLNVTGRRHIAAQLLTALLKLAGGTQ